jgi:hypothetical protein
MPVEEGEVAAAEHDENDDDGAAEKRILESGEEESGENAPAWEEAVESGRKAGDHHAFLLERDDTDALGAGQAEFGEDDEPVDEDTCI